MDIKDIRRLRLKEWFSDKPLPEKEKSYLSQLITGKSTSFGEKAARRLESTYGMPVGHLDLAVAQEKSNVTFIGPHVKGDKYPLISWVSAGAWCEAIEPYTLKDIDEWFESDARIEGNGFWLRVEGDSMTAPTGISIPEDTLVLFDSGREARNGSLVIAKLESANEATFKKLIIDGGAKYLRGLNPAWPLVPIDGNCKIIGVAVETKLRLV